MQQEAGLYGRELRRGTLIGGRRIVDMRPGIVDQRRTVTVRFDETVIRKGRVRRRLSDPVTYLFDQRVPGTARPTTHAMPAGPVHRKPGTKANGGWYGDDGDTGRGAAADRHQRRIEALTYA